MQRLQKMAQVVILLALLCVSATAFAASPGQFDWRKFEGTSIRVWLPGQMYTDFLKPRIPEFEKLTGIKVTYDLIGDAPYRTSLPVARAIST